ncbi:MAG: T9SS type A sorting domain-containing protein [Candidatus Stygibacter australis]|nr:T9SS type A sorting domain-containing protein [Candidatus Stygibacter australis]MDP8322764.1 T9SS type A sorting domain-containing protein [Candidatus Stygibacter australis]
MPRNIIIIIIIILCVTLFLEAEPTFFNSYPYRDLFEEYFAYSYRDGSCNVIPAIGGGFLLNAYVTPGYEFYSEPQSMFWKISEEGEMEWRVQDASIFSNYFGSLVSNEVDRYYAIGGRGGGYTFPRVLYILDENCGLISTHNYWDIDSLRVTINSMQIIEDGLIMAGMADNYPSPSIMKTDFDGNIIWYKCGYDLMINGEYPPEMNTIIQTSDGGFLTCGFKTYNPFWGTLMKFNSEGDTLWTKTRENAMFSSLLEYDEDTLFTFSWQSDYVRGRGFLLKYNISGMLLEEYDILTPFYDQSNTSRLLKLNDSNILITFNAEEGEIHKVTFDGEVLWSRNYLENSPAYPDWIGKEDKKGFEHINGDIIYCGTTDRQCLFPEFVLLRVDEEGNLIVDNNELPGIKQRLSNYPNPFNPITTIKYEIDSNLENTIIEISNIKGQKVRELKIAHEGVINGKSGEIIWDGKNQAGALVGSGVYYYQLMTNGEKKAANKMLLIK